MVFAEPSGYPAHCLYHASTMNPLQEISHQNYFAILSAVSARLHYLGWGDVSMDYHSLQLAAVCLAER
jgi:hypothetical protein